MPFPVEKIREDFPILKRKIRTKPLVYLDSAASSQKPSVVLEAMQKFYELSYANIHRGVYTIAEEATEQYEEARGAAARFLGAAKPHEIIFTRGTTEAINLVARTWGEANIGEGNTILLTQMEHHSNLVPWQMLAKRKNARLQFIPVDDNGRLRLDTLQNLLTPRTKLLAMTLASNMLGTLPPAEQIIPMAKTHGVPVLLDAAQAVPHLRIDVQKLDCDFLAFSGHKMLGPTGIGGLYAKTRHLEEMDPFLGGGEMIKTVEWDHATWNDLPWKFEAGTQSIAEAVGLKAAIEYLESAGLEAIHAHEQSLVRYTLERLPEIEGIRIYGPPADERVGLVSFNIAGIHPHDIAAMLDRNGICVRAGHHCTQPLHRRLGLEASVRASFYLYNTRQEVDSLIEALRETATFFTK